MTHRFGRNSRLLKRQGSRSQSTEGGGTRFGTPPLPPPAATSGQHYLHWPAIANQSATGQRFGRTQSMRAAPAGASKITGAAILRPGQSTRIRLIPTTYPFFKPISARVTVGPARRGPAPKGMAESAGSQPVSFDTRVGLKSLGKSGFRPGEMSLKNWPIGSTVGLGDEYSVVVRNRGSSAVRIQIDMSVKPQSSKGGSTGSRGRVSRSRKGRRQRGRRFSGPG